MVHRTHTYTFTCTYAYTYTYTHTQTLTFMQGKDLHTGTPHTHMHVTQRTHTHTHTDFVVFEWRNAFLYLDGPHVSSLDVQPVCCVLSETLLPQSSPTMVVFVCVIKEGRASGYQ